MNDPQPRQAADRDVTSYIGERDRTRGDVHVGGGLRIDGVARGDILAGSEDATLIVGAGARIEGNVRVRRARVAGHVTGTVTVDGHLEVTEGGVIEGDVRYGSLAIASGAALTGTLTPLRLEE